MAEAARREDEPDREMLRQAVVAVHRRAHKMLYGHALQRRFLMSDITLIELELRARRGRLTPLSGGARGSGGGGEPPDIGPEGAD